MDRMLALQFLVLVFLVSVPYGRTQDKRLGGGAGPRFNNQGHGNIVPSETDGYSIRSINPGPRPSNRPVVQQYSQPPQSQSVAPENSPAFQQYSFPGAEQGGALLQQYELPAIQTTAGQTSPHSQQYSVPAAQSISPQDLQYFAPPGPSIIPVPFPQQFSPHAAQFSPQQNIPIPQQYTAQQPQPLLPQHYPAPQQYASQTTQTGSPQNIPVPQQHAARSAQPAVPQNIPQTQSVNSGKNPGLQQFSPSGPHIPDAAYNNLGQKQQQQQQQQEQQLQQLLQQQYPLHGFFNNAVPQQQLLGNGYGGISGLESGLPGGQFNFGSHYNFGGFPGVQNFDYNNLAALNFGSAFHGLGGALDNSNPFLINGAGLPQIPAGHGGGNTVGAESGSNQTPVPKNGGSVEIVSSQTYNGGNGEGVKSAGGNTGAASPSKPEASASVNVLQTTSYTNSGSNKVARAGNTSGNGAQYGSAPKGR